VLFNSYIFVLFFLPVCMLGYFGLNRLGRYALAQAFLLGMSLWFYGYFNPSYLTIILASIFFNYGMTLAMDRTKKGKLRKLELIFALTVNLGILFYYKYYDFFVDNLNQIFHSDLLLRNVVLPLGISFFTFQQISYVIDAYRGEVSRYSFLQYASFVAYFPQLVAGPIVSHDELIPQFADLSKKKFDWDNFARGIYIFTLGMAKKILIADVFGNAANWGFSLISGLDSTNAILVTLAYTIQIYFDFSGYCDMAIGLGKMMNLDLPINFDSPYKAVSIIEFWKRWHKTLTRFFTKYVYIPLGGNRKGTARTYCNVMIVFLLSGLWHGADWSFVAWGGIHGALQVMERMGKKYLEKIPRFFRWVGTFSLVNVAFIFFRAGSVRNALMIIKRILSLRFGPVDQQVIQAFQLPEIQYVVEKLLYWDHLTWLPMVITIAFFVISVLCAARGRNAYERMQTMEFNWYTMLGTAVLLVWCVMSFAGISTFLYFNF